MKQQTIGIVGGMGMAAGIELEQLIVAELENTGLQEIDYPRIIAIHDSKVPDRSAFLLGHGANPAPQLSKIIDTLGSLGADTIVIPCNTSFSSRIMGRVESDHLSRVISIIDTVATTIKSRYTRGSTVGLMATQGSYLSGVYKEVLEAAGYLYTEPDEAGKQRIMNAIYQIKQDGITTRSDSALKAEFDKLAATCDAVILGCTEIGLSSLVNQPKAIDSLRELAKALVS